MYNLVECNNIYCIKNVQHHVIILPQYIKINHIHKNIMSYLMSYIQYHDQKIFFQNESKLLCVDPPPNIYWPSSKKKWRVFTKMTL